MKIPVLILMLSVTLIKCDMSPFVVGGGKANIIDFPYSAYLNIHCTQTDGETIYACGSSIVNQYVTLTAAHCLFYCTDDSTLSLSVGNSDRRLGVYSSANRFLLHEEYEDETAKNDIALVSLTTPLKFNDSVSRAVFVRNPPHDREAWIAGWGLYNENSTLRTDRLLYTTQFVMEREECLRLLKSIPIGTICGSSKTLRGYAAVGDSGSALVVNNYIQIGIVSFKKPTISDSVVIYTDTGYFYDWLIANTRKIICDQS